MGRIKASELFVIRIIVLSSSDVELRFVVKRQQFPVAPAFATAINQP